MSCYVLCSYTRYRKYRFALLIDMRTWHKSVCMFYVSYSISCGTSPRNKFRYRLQLENDRKLRFINTRNDSSRFAQRNRLLIPVKSTEIRSIYHFPNDFKLKGIPFCSKSIRKWWIQSDFTCFSKNQKVASLGAAYALQLLARPVNNFKSSWKK